MQKEFPRFVYTKSVATMHDKYFEGDEIYRIFV